ncbi:MAG: NTP transferase domain-containing protein [Sphingomonas sp.]|uniref:NTP transferase domain-containing protein n=1 Tax=Sphingomonas sp. TaxID=28214 RepID=UPI0025CF59B7|nr:NTP transferase domain-containing protein [Sphingomonas sp.]MBX9882511.1 NTP transferase domain-containing protein [Sphingomonas sp.]
MVDASRTLLALLAAGRSERFGPEDKLAADFLGRPLASHVATALEAVPFLARVAIVSGTGVAFPGYRRIENPAPDAGLSGSVRLAAQAARDCGAAALLIALADMPRVTAVQILRLLDAAQTADAVVASSDGARPSPPALFAAGRFAELLALEGDHGARALIQGGVHIVTSPQELIDIDTPEDLARLRALA